jgi:predicted small metal-binding protein
MVDFNNFNLKNKIMKTMTCEQMGGPCSYKMSADTPKEMLEMGMDHVKENHPNVAKNVENMSADENKKWNDTFMKNWDMSPEGA